MKTLMDLDDLLKDPAGTARRGLEGSVRAGTPARLLLGAGVLAAFYGASAGFFQGGAQIGVAALKAPLIVLGSLLLCAPSLYVFSALAGVRRPPRAFFLDLACFAGSCSPRCFPSRGSSRSAADRFSSWSGST